MRTELPTGTVTFVFTDVEGSTSLPNELAAEAYADALADHRSFVREACTGNSGVEVDTQGDAFFFAFPTALGALDAASRQGRDWRDVRSSPGNSAAYMRVARMQNPSRLSFEVSPSELERCTSGTAPCSR